MLSFGTAIPSPSMILSAPESNYIHFTTSYQSLSITLSHYSFSVLFYVRVQLHKVLSQGFDDSSWPLQTKTGRYICYAYFCCYCYCYLILPPQIIDETCFIHLFLRYNSFMLFIHNNPSDKLTTGNTCFHFIIIIIH